MIYHDLEYHVVYESYLDILYSSNSLKCSFLEFGGSNTPCCGGSNLICILVYPFDLVVIPR